MAAYGVNCALGVPKLTARKTSTHSSHYLDCDARMGADHLRMRSVSFSYDYKAIALYCSSSVAPRVFFINPDDSRPCKSRIPVQPFGIRRAISNWGRAVTFAQFLSQNLLAPAVGASPMTFNSPMAITLRKAASGPSVNCARPSDFARPTRRIGRRLRR